MNGSSSFFQLPSVVVVLLLGLVAPMAIADDVDFQADIAPLLSKHCGECHGPNKQRGGLRFDFDLAAMDESDSGGPAIVAGKPDESELLRRIASDDDGEWMPPEGPRLPETEIALLRKWIEHGANWPVTDIENEAASEMVVTDEDRQFWSFRKLAPVEIPDLNDKWIRNPIDQFTLARLQEMNLRLNPVASPL